LLLFVGIGSFGPRNAVAVAARIVTALSIASAIALIDDLDAPYRGFIVVRGQAETARAARSCRKSEIRLGLLHEQLGFLPHARS
jgi:hypothetical protein